MMRISVGKMKMKTPLHQGALGLPYLLRKRPEEAIFQAALTLT
jgi:hypothetical protein